MLQRFCPTNQKLLAKQYKISVETLKKHVSPDYKKDPKYRFYNGKHVESHLYEVLAPQSGYTYVFKTPVAINSRSDIRKKIISEIRSMELANTLNYPKSGYKLKTITGFNIYIYFREHTLGDSEAVIPQIIRDNMHIINFPKTNNKCMFHCIAWHLHQQAKKDLRRIQAQVKEEFKRYCFYKGVQYSLSLFRSFKPIDLLQLDELEECFRFGINVYSMDVKTGNAECIRRSEREGVAMDILSHENHGFLVTIESFPAEPIIYKPAPNAIRSLLTKYSIKDANQYIDHFIVYDFEAILMPTATHHGENTVFMNEHIPASVSVADSLTEEVRCFVNEDPKTLLMDMFKYIGDVSVKIQQYNVDMCKSLLQKVINAHGLTGMEVPGVNHGNKYKMSDVESWIKEGKYGSFFHFHSSLGFRKHRSDYGRLKQQIDQVPVLGFNSGRYDINLIKNDLFANIGTDNIKSVIKNPSYMCIATSKMKMLDSSNYVPAGTSYDKCRVGTRPKYVCTLPTNNTPRVREDSWSLSGKSNLKAQNIALTPGWLFPLCTVVTTGHWQSPAPLATSDG
ncbi:unnamed protein product [Phytophthora lilii]|uniref:Unnamed protein product n=1 Tax=Phytophthora lilii TaxID=2077276 RepID=A0A9W6X4R4_9STRA|nr:unnamed protein product [Phytophthora lilii]